MLSVARKSELHAATKWLASVAATLALAACGGGGGGSDPAPVPPPTVSISASPTSVTPGGSVTITWQSTNATSCAASGGWSGGKQPSGTEAISNLTSTTTFTLTCTGPSGTSLLASQTVTVTPPPGSTVSVAGRITYGRVPFGSGSSGLNYGAATQEPSRGIVVQAIDAQTAAVVATSNTDANGDYTLTVPAGTNMFIRAVAQMVRDTTQLLPRWRFEVRDLPPTTEVPSSLPPIFTFDGGAFDSSTPGAKNVQIPTGINASGQATGTRHSAPFAILDTIYRAYNTILSVQPTADFTPLIIDWGATNVGGQTFFTVSPVQGQTTRQPKIVLAADLASDTDEFDAHVVAHEFGHYIEEYFSRADSIGGPHGPGDQLDPRVAFGEGYGYAFAGFVLEDPLARDSFVSGGVQRSSNFNIETNNGFANPGWYNESTVWEILWDLYDTNADANDTLALGLEPIWQVLTGDQRDTDALTTIFSFASALKAQRPGVAAAIDQIVGSKSIVAPTINAFGTTETNAGNPSGGTDVLPIFANIAANSTPVTVRSVGTYGSGGNKLSAHRFLRLDIAQTRTVRVTLTSSPAGRDADIFVIRRGVAVANGIAFGNEDFTVTLQPGTYVLDVYDCENAECSDAASYNYAPVDITVTLTPQ